MTTTVSLERWLEAAAAVQLGVAMLNLKLVRWLRWRVELLGLPLLMREVFQVHVWFISLTLAIFGVTTLRFAGLMASRANPALAWLAAALAIFWGLRVVVQVGYYSASHWRGDTARTVVHLLLLIVYGGITAVYGIAAWGS